MSRRSRGARAIRRTPRLSTPFPPQVSPSSHTPSPSPKIRSAALASSPRFSAALSWRSLIIIAFHFLLFTVPLFFTWVNEELFEFNKMLLTFGITVLIVGFWGARMITERRWILRRTPLDYPILMFVVSQLISTLFSIHGPTSWFGYYTRFHGSMLSTLAYVILFYAFVSNVRIKEIRPLLITTFLSSLLISAMAIPEHFGHSFSCLLINTVQGTKQTGWGALAPNALATAYNASCWIQDVQTRVFASFGQPNWLAAYAITLLPVGVVCIWDAIQRQQSKTSWFYGVAVVGLFLDLLFTKSRSGVLGLAVATAIFGGFLVVRWVLDYRGQSVKELIARLSLRSAWPQILRSPLIITLLGCAVALLLFGSPYTPSVLDKLVKPSSSEKVVTSPTATAPVTATASGSAGSTEAASTVPNRLDIGGTDSGEIRKIVWTGALQVWKRYPLFGSGVETFAYSYYLDRPVEHNLVSEWDFLYNKAHNEFLNYLATTGFFGFFAYTIMIGAFILAPLWEMILRHWRSTLASLRIAPATDLPSGQYRLQLLDVAVSSGIVALSISNFFGFSTVMVTILMFVFPAMVFVFRRGDLAARDLSASAETTSESSLLRSLQSAAFEQLFFLLLLTVAIILTLSRIFIWWYTDSLYALSKQYSQIGQYTTSIPLVQRAVSLSPNDGTYDEELAIQYAKLAAGIAEGGDATSATQIANQAIQIANRMLELNQVNLNFYKSYVRVLLTLAPYQTSLLYQARDLLTHAVQLAPTDAKLLYNLALVELSMNFPTEGLRHLEQVVAMKPNYEAARLTLGDQYQTLGRLNEARAQYEYILANIQPNNAQAKQKIKELQGSAVPTK